MYLSKITIKNFRKYDAEGIVVNFHKGLNALVGENDSGKSTIIDAIKLVLQTQSGDYVRVDEDDFHREESGERSSEFTIECKFEGLNDNEAKNFIEWLTFKNNDQTDIVEYSLCLYFRAWQDGKRTYHELKAGTDENSIAFDGKARELLKCVYLKPLRDAERDLTRGKNSRISQILYNHPLFADNENNRLEDFFNEANNNIEKFFKEEEGKEILGIIQTILESFIENGNPENALIKTSEIRLKAILESLSLLVSEPRPGLGIHNLLFIAAELLLLNSNNDGSVKLALIEELEAHLHPQAQLRLIAYLQKEYDESGVQIIISTHSPILTSKINVKNIILVKVNKAYELLPEKTLLTKGDYLFLQRFLDSSKANFFFAKGIIMVEGDAEALFIPILADILDINLEKHGISLVKIGHIGFFRYSRIFLRQDNEIIPIPISIVTDSDTKPVYENGTITNECIEETEKKINNIQEKYNKNNVKAFVAPRWTFEYSIAMSCLKEKLYISILEAEKIKNSDENVLTNKKIEDIEKFVNQSVIDLDSPSCDFAYNIYKNIMIDKEISKAIVAQCLASNLRYHIVESAIGEELPKEKMFDLDLYQTKIDEEKRAKLSKEIREDEFLKYLVDAIEYAAGKSN